MQRILEERRKYVRLPASLKVKYTVEGTAAKLVQEAISRNISQNGILLTTEKALPVSTKLNLEICFPKLSNPILAEGKVVWLEEITEGKFYNLGVTFIKINQEDSQIIQDYTQAININKILLFAATNKASDVHLVANQPPVMRILGTLVPMRIKQLSAAEIKNLIYGFLTKNQIEEFERELELDISYMTDFGRFRVNIHKEKGQLGANFRYVPTKIPTIADLGLPPAVEELARVNYGLILVTGPSGCGKSTTLAAMIDLINSEKNRMIMSLEDPIEYLHRPKKSIVKQREIGPDSPSFISAFKHVLRQDVDVILIGEMRDLESVSIALIAAEAGHLVLSTLHTSDTITSINRIISIFPANQQQQVRTQIAETLRGVISQVLIPRKDRQDRVVATEVLTVTPAIQNLIRQGHIEQIRSELQIGTKHGMHLMDVSIEHLYKQGIISREQVLLYAKEPAKIIST